MTRSKGFTLAEMAMALAILALLLFGALVPFTSQLDIRNVADTRRTMSSTLDAIVGFALTNGRLPCPANGATAAGVAGAGTEQFGVGGNVCASAIGVVPWATLGTPEVDAWGNRFTYRVSPAFADLAAAGTWATATSTTPASPNNQNVTCGLPTLVPVPSAPTSFALCTLGDMAVLTRGASASTSSGSSLPLVIISHGKNGKGAWQPDGIRLAGPPAGTDEAANVNGNINFVIPNPSPPPPGYSQVIFYSRTPAPATGGCVDPAALGAANTSPLCEFDDLVVTISSSALIARMVAAGRLP